ncbi:MAG: TetR family transcriptional regulator [Frankiales bacterium]|jgi:AcrR family transcriptional regulator|nr:TetR family transcriptional regulator [Frankiales bacterium]
MTAREAAVAEREVTAARAPRKDAARNHALLLEAAREVFAERGLDASLDDIARRAGLGIGTAYRHFQNKQQVAEALFSKAIAEIVADAERALTREDPWQAFVEFFTSAAERQANDRGLYEALIDASLLGDCGRIRDQLDGPLARLFDQAIQAGALRADATPTDAGVIFAMLGAVYEMRGDGSPELWRRYLAVLLDGLRATGQRPLPAAALTEDELDLAIAHHHSRLRGD